MNLADRWCKLIESEFPGGGYTLNADSNRVVGQLIAWENGHIDLTVLNVSTGRGVLCCTEIFYTEEELSDVLFRFIEVLLDVEHDRAGS